MRFTKKQLEAVLACASKDKARVALNCVRFERDRLVATDGHRLAIIEAESEEDWVHYDAPFEVLAADLKPIVKVMMAGSTAEFRCSPVPADPAAPTGTAVVRMLDCQGGVAWPISQAEVDYPNYRQIEKGLPAAQLSICFNANYLREICAQMVKAGLDKSNHPVKMQFGDSLEPVKLSSGTLSVVLMPMRE